MVKVMQVVDDNDILSTQGEQQRDYKIPVMSEGDVEAFLGTIPRKAIPCRKTNRHVYDEEADLRFVGVNTIGLLLRPLTCLRCEMATRVEEWDMRHYRGRVTRCELVDSKVRYKKGPNGESYHAPKGQGRVLGRTVRNVTATRQLKDQSFKELRKGAIENARDAYAAELEAATPRPAPEADAG